jgi:hypothetical protein
MAVEGREQVTRIGIVRVNGQPEELDGSDGRRQPSGGGTSRVSREAQARICERLGVQLPGPTRRLTKENVLGQADFIAGLFGLAA